MRMREVVMEEQIQWVLSYIQEESVDIWKENILEDLKKGLLKYEMAGNSKYKERVWRGI